MAEEQEQPKKKNGRLKKTFKWIVGLIVLLAMLTVAGIYYIWNYFDWQSKVRELVHQYGTQAVGTSVNVGDINVSLSGGSGYIGNITVANPKGYTQDNIIKLGKVSVVLNKDSIKKVLEETVKKTGSKTKTIVIDEIRIEKPEVAYELMNLNKNNANDVLANIRKNSEAKPDKKTTPKDDSANEYKIAIKKLVIADGTATVAAGLMGVSQSLSLDLPTITIDNLGSDKQGITIEDGLSMVFQTILRTTAAVVAKTDLSELLGGITGAAGKVVNDAADAVTGGVKSVTDGIGGLFK
ncbi:MAG: hypothetical protein IJS88_04225 [Alphaproteobacteria bacterium]|nr:hypothetical protein [Alphaproteobacteria bacterium]